jgi:hypothetical protein
MLPPILVPGVVRHSKATDLTPPDYTPPSLAARQQPLIVNSMRNTTPPVRPRLGGII